MESDWTLTRLDGRDDVALVTVDLRNPSPVDRRVRVENRLDGPVLPPRRAGVPEPGWDDDGFTGVVPAGERRALGYACPAPGERPPVSVADEGRATDGEPVSAVATAVRELADARPPADAVPDASPPAATDDDEGRGTPADDDAAAPEAVEAWLTAAERRIERGERLTDASASTAAAALEGADDVTTLDARVAADADALRAVSERAAALADRATAVDVPVDALRRLA
ncbi:hypothetical protein [Haloplanus halophilus]|uniref:DUF7857 domain-containing protein n=1 Tax=Haloplanus halophilus TaxID=2949993 RepID=UPI00203BD1DD|nr:hypothetical protein [Haloplanus sp. GDY1]